MLFDDRYFLVAVLKSSKKGYTIIPHEDLDIEVIDNEESYIENTCMVLIVYQKKMV